MGLRNISSLFACICLNYVGFGQASTVDIPRTNSVPKVKEYLSTTVIDAETREFKPGDVFLYGVKEDPAPKGGGMSRVVVNDAGEAIFPVSYETKLYVKVDVRSMKLPEIRQKVKELLDAEYYNDATVLLEFTVANRSRLEDAQVQVYGEMQGVVLLRENEVRRVSDAILTLARTPFADLRRVRLHRIDPNTGKEEIQIINVDKILKDGDRSTDVVLQDGDRIEVRPKTFNF